MGEVIDQPVLIVTPFEEWMTRELTELVKAAYESTPWMRAFGYDENRVQEMIGYAVFHPERVCGLAAVEMGESRSVVGALAATISGVPFSNDLVASDVFTHGTPEAMPKLLAAFERWAKRAGAKHVTVTLGAPIDGWTAIGTRLMKNEGA